MLARADPRSAAAVVADVTAEIKESVASSTIGATATTIALAATISGHVRLLSGGRAPAYL